MSFPFKKLALHPPSTRACCLMTTYLGNISSHLETLTSPLLSIPWFYHREIHRTALIHQISYPLSENYENVYTDSSQQLGCEFQFQRDHNQYFLQFDCSHARSCSTILSLPFDLSHHRFSPPLPFVLVSTKYVLKMDDTRRRWLKLICHLFNISMNILALYSNTRF